MIPIRLHLSGFLSYLDPVDVDFEAFDLACISGQNGAGKSSLLDGITWALFGEARKRDDSLINSAADAAEVIFTFDYEDSRYRVQRSKPRGKTTLLEFSQRDAEGNWHPLTEATLRATEQRIVNTLRLDYETFTNASFFLQGKADQFTQQNPTDRKRILSNMLGLEVWETYKEEAARRRRLAENQEALLEGQIVNIEEELNQEDERKTLLAQAEAEYDTEKARLDAKKASLDQVRLVHEGIERERQQIERQQAEILRQRQTLEAQVRTLQERQQERTQLQEQLSQATEIDAAVAQWQKDQQALEAYEQQSARAQELQAQRQPPLREIAAEQARLETQLQQLQTSEKNAAQMRLDLAAHRQNFEKLQQNAAQLSETLSSRETLEADRLALSEQRGQAKAENQTLMAEMKELRERIDALAVVKEAVCPLCGQPLAEPERVALLTDLETNGKEKGDAFRKNEKLIADCETRYRELENRLHSLAAQEPELKRLNSQTAALEHELNLISSALQEWEEHGPSELQQAAAALANQTFAPAARQTLAALDDQLKQLGYDAAAHSALREREKAGRASRDAQLTLEKARARLEPLQREIEQTLASCTEQEKHLDELAREISKQQATLQDKTANLPDLTILENETFAQQEKVNQLLQIAANRRSQVQVLDTLRQQKAQLTQKKSANAEEITRLKQLEKAFGKDGIPALLIERSLPEIESDANELLDRLSDGNMSVHFETRREFKDKKREDKKETLDIIIHDGSGDRDYELFSGGEAFRINFAIRLALSRMLARRAGARLQTLVIDEGFGSQDAEGRQHLIEAINSVRGNFAKILVITHMEELKDAFSARIEVSKTERGSRVQVVAA
ncbi:MAG: SMC family ATPase [Anaerolineaceae bacterium]|nr:SMC family ATPase [Anaerolineaceae bacterium]